MADKMYSDPCILCEKAGHSKYCERCSVTGNKSKIEKLTKELTEALTNLNLYKKQLEEADKACDECKKSHAEYMDIHNIHFAESIKRTKVDMIEAVERKIPECVWEYGTAHVCNIDLLKEFLADMKGKLE